MIQIFSADGRDGTGPTKGSTRGPRGPKNRLCSDRETLIDILSERDDDADVNADDGGKQFVLGPLARLPRGH